VLHKDGDYDVDKDELSDEHEDDEEDRSNDTTDAAVVNTVVRRVAIFSQRVLCHIDISQHLTAVRLTL